MRGVSMSIVVRISFLPADVVGVVVGIGAVLVLEKELLAPCTATKNDPKSNISNSNFINNNTPMHAKAH